MRYQMHVWIGIFIAAVCLYLAFRGISFAQLWSALSHANPWPIVMAIALSVVSYFLRAERWAVLIKPVQPIKAAQLFWVLVIGFFANNILPLRMGELVRAHVCGKKFQISRTASLGTILLERLCDTLSFLTTFLVASLFVPFPGYMKKGALLLGAACFLVIVSLFLIHRHEDRFRAILNGSPLPARWKEIVHDSTTHFIHSISGITQPRFVAEAMAFSLVIWIIEGTFLYLMSRAFAIHLSYASAFFLLFALGLSVTLPQAPGYVGTFELFGVTALALLGIPKNQALPLVLAIHGTQFLFIAVLGCVALWKEGLTFHTLTERSEA
jgi:uncharacterized protein (TIRG00374 family)